MRIYRNHTLVDVPDTYADDPAHRLLVHQLETAKKLTDVIAIMSAHASGSWLVCDVLTGQPWARKFLQTTAKFSAGSPTEQRVARAAMRALVAVVRGGPTKRGRKKAVPPRLSVLIEAHRKVDAARVFLKSQWSQPEGLVSACRQQFPWFTRVHARTLTALLRRPGASPARIAQHLVSWETGLPLRRLRSATAEFVYR